jgi:hypothetical protein
MSISQMLAFLLLGGLMGLLGQGARTVVGLKSMTEDAKSLGLSPNDMFQAARLVTSLIIGFLVGVAAALIYMSSHTLTDTSTIAWNVLLGFAASGYAGTDFLESFISKYLPSGNQVSTNALGAKIDSLTAQLADQTDIDPTTATQFVISVLHDIDPDAKIDGTTKLTVFDLNDVQSLDGLAAKINRRKWHGVFVDNPTIEKCKTVQNVIDAVTKAMK